MDEVVLGSGNLVSGQSMDPKSFPKEFSTGYLIGEILHKYELQDDFNQFSQSRVANSKLNNFSRLEPTLQLLGVQFDQNEAQNIMTEQHGAATRLLYQLYVALEKKKKAGLTGVAMETMRPAAPAKLKGIESELYRERLRNLMPRQTDLRLQQVSENFEMKSKHMENKIARIHFAEQQKVKKIQEEQRAQDIEKVKRRRRQNEIMARIQAAIIQIPKPPPNRTLKAIEVQKLLKKKKEAEDAYLEIKTFEKFMRKESPTSSSPDTTPQATTELLSTYSDDEYIRKIQKRLEEDSFAREQREKRRRKMLMEQLIAHEAQEEAYREEQLINRLMRQSQQERRIAVQLMHVRHEKEVLWQNRIFREKQYEERRLKEFQEALDREAALAKQEKIDYEEQTARERDLHEKIAAERVEARYKKHYSMCWEVIDQIIDLSTKTGEYRILTNNLIPNKLMRDWKELFFNGKPIYEQASIKPLPTEPTPEQLVELDKMNLLDEKDYDEYKSMIGEWCPPEEHNGNKPPHNTNILGHVVHRLMDIVYPPKPEPPSPVFPSFPIQGCILGKLFSGKSTCVKFLEEACNIQALSVDTLVQETIKAFHESEMKSESNLISQEAEGSGKQKEVSASFNLVLTLIRSSDKEQVRRKVYCSCFFLFNMIRACLGEASEKLLKKGKNIPDELLVDIMVEATKRIPQQKGWIMDGFPMTINQAKLLEKALRGRDPDKAETKDKMSKKPSLVTAPAAPKDPPLSPPAFDFALLLDISDTTVLKRMAGLKCEEKIDLVRDQIQHRIAGFLDTWPNLEKWFSVKQNILVKVNGETEENLLCKRIKEIVLEEIAKKQNKSKVYFICFSDRDFNIKVCSIRGKSPGKKSSPATPEDLPPLIPVGPPPIKPGSDEWVYVDEPLPKEIPQFLVPYWETIENTYENTIKTILRFTVVYCIKIHILYYSFSTLYNHKQEFVAQWQSDYNSIADDLWEDEETKAELHQRVTDLRDRLWDICENRKEEAEQERSDIMNDGWLPDHMGILLNHFFSLMQVEVDRFQDTKRFLHDYYRGMEGKMPSEASQEFTRIPLLDIVNVEIPMVPRRPPSPEINVTKQKSKATQLKSNKDENSSENVTFNFGADEKLITDTWHTAVAAISNMVRNLKKQELKLKMKQEYFSALEYEEEAAKSRLQLIKTKALAFVEELIMKAEETYKCMEKWLGARFLAEMSSVDKLTEVARHHIESFTRIHYELILDETDFFINSDVKVIPDPVPPPRPPPVETSVNGTLTIAQLSTLHKQFLQVAPKGLISNKMFIDILLDLITLNLGTNNLPDVWMHLTVSDLQNLASTLTVNSELIDWRRFLLTAAQPWPVPTLIQLLKTLHSFKTIDEAGSGFVTEEYYNQVGLWFEGTEELKIPENPIDPLPFNRLEHLIMFFFILFADARKDPLQLDYIKMLLYFASHPDAVEGVYRALSIATGTYIHRGKEVTPPNVVKCDYLNHARPLTAESSYRNAFFPQSLSHIDMLIKEESLVEKEEIPYCTDEGRISMTSLLRVFKHEGSKAVDNHRFSGQQNAGNYNKHFIKIYKELGSEDLKPISVTVLLKHPFIQDLINNYQGYKLPVSISFLRRSTV
uniref:Sperm flagellar 2 n=1 Tax=Pelusios castaneus TaxID=367368 RepID=A0A8C8VQB0_9SAUR